MCKRQHSNSRSSVVSVYIPNFFDSPFSYAHFLLKRESITIYSFALSNSSNGFASTTYLMAIARNCETRFEYIFVFPRDAK